LTTAPLEHETDWLDSTNATTKMTTLAENASENKTVVEAVRCETNDDCKGFHIATGPGSMVICDEYIKICIIAIVEEKPVAPNATTKRPRRTTPKPDNNNDLVPVENAAWV